MSPSTLRRYRAERLLRSEFDALRGQVLATVRHRLLGYGVQLDRGDLEACYSLAWQGLYGALLDGREVVSPKGWLVLVTLRRALDEHRASTRARRAGEACSVVEPDERDLADELEDRRRLRALFAGLRGRLDAREREAATLCYLQGFTRAQAAAHMGLSERGMRRLMEGRGPGRPGVASKVGELARAIADGSWCAEQASLMRALAFGVLDPEGERHALALAHSEECPACRAYVASLRGLAAVLPPVLTPSGIGAAILGAHGGHAVGASHAAGGLPGSHGLATPHGLAEGAARSSGAGGSALAASGTTGGWALAGGAGAKLAGGCLLALGVGAGCLAVGGPGAPTHVVRGAVGDRHAHVRIASATQPAWQPGLPTAPASGALAARLTAGSLGGHAATLHAQREFGIEQPGALRSGEGEARAGAPASTAASTASAALSASAARAPATQTPAVSEPATASGSSASGSSPVGDARAAQREFSPG